MGSSNFRTLNWIERRRQKLEKERKKEGRENLVRLHRRRVGPLFYNSHFDESSFRSQRKCGKDMPLKKCQNKKCKRTKIKVLRLTTNSILPTIILLASWNIGTLFSTMFFKNSHSVLIRCKRKTQ